MKKWVDYQKQHQAVSGMLPHLVFDNYVTATDHLRNWIETGQYHVQDYRIFDFARYTDEILSAYPDISLTKDTIMEWLSEKKYQQLTIASHLAGAIMDIPDSVFEKFKTDLGYFPVDWSTAKKFIFLQRPGEMTPVHYDIPKNEFYNLKSDENMIHRWSFMLYDQQPGQNFVIQGTSIDWRAGDAVHGWQSKYWHGTANYGYETRYTLMLTAKVLDPSFIPAKH